MWWPREDERAGFGSRGCPQILDRGRRFYPRSLLLRALASEATRQVHTSQPPSIIKRDISLRKSGFFSKKRDSMVTYYMTSFYVDSRFNAAYVYGWSQLFKDESANHKRVEDSVLRFQQKSNVVWRGPLRLVVHIPLPSLLL